MASRFIIPTARAALQRQPAGLLGRRFASTAARDPIFAEQEASKAHAAGSAELWRKISVYICIPGSLVIGTFIYQIETSHLAHRDHEIAMNGGELPEEEKPKYEYQQIRKKPFAWGLQSFFFNPKVNYPAEL